MDCPSENTLVSFLDGGLDAPAQERLAAHVAACGECRSVLLQLGQSALVATAVSRPSPPAPGPERLTSGALLADRYRIVRFIAAGGMGEVYEAHDLELGTRVALKRIRPDVVSDPRAVERFKREIHLLRRVTHPNVCRIFDVGFLPRAPTGRVPFLTMELLVGETLAERLARVVRLTPDEALPIAEQLAEALSAAHAAGVVHRDFKSANIMLVPGRSGRDAAPRAVVMDFGVARASDGLDLARTASGDRAVVGSPLYMAPEQLQGVEATAAADIYAYGVVLYEMVTGRLPFEGATALLLALRRLEHPPTPPSRWVPELPEPWEHVLLRCLEREPSARFSSVIEAYEALRRGRAMRPDAARRSSEEAAFALAPTEYQSGELPVGRARARGLRRFGAAALVLALGIAVTAWVRSRGSERAGVPKVAASLVVPHDTPAAIPAVASPPSGTPALAPASAATETVLVRSQPSGAAVFLAGQRVATTPASLRVLLPQEVTLKLAGHAPVQKRLVAPGVVTVRLVASRPDPGPQPGAQPRLLDE